MFFVLKIVFAVFLFKTARNFLRVKMFQFCFRAHTNCNIFRCCIQNIVFVLSFQITNVIISRFRFICFAPRQNPDYWSAKCAKKCSDLKFSWQACWEAGERRVGCSSPPTSSPRPAVPTAQSFAGFWTVIFAGRLLIFDSCFLVGCYASFARCCRIFEVSIHFQGSSHFRFFCFLSIHTFVVLSCLYTVSPRNSPLLRPVSHRVG